MCLSEAALEALRRRAVPWALTLGDYLGMVLRYMLPAESAARVTQLPVALPGDPVYFAIELSVSLRERLEAESRRQSGTLARVAGLLAEEFAHQFERDPVDLRMIHELSRLLEETGRVSDADLARLFGLVESGSISRMPLDYRVRWYHRRVQAHLRHVEVSGARVELTPEIVAGVLRPPPAPPNPSPPPSPPALPTAAVLPSRSDSPPGH